MQRRVEIASSHLLLIRFSALGDVAMAGPVITGLKKRYPRLQISLLSKPFPLQVYKHIDKLELIAFDNNKHEGLLGIWRLSKELKATGITHCADLHFSLRSRVLTFFLRLQGVRVTARSKERGLRRKWVKKGPKPQQQLVSQLEHYRRAIETLGFALEPSDFRLFDRIDRPQNAAEFDKRLVGIAPFAAHAPKKYPEKLMYQVLKGLSKKYQLVLFGSKGQESDQIDRWVSDNLQLINAAKFSFEQQLQWISNLDLTISMDSANGHLAANYGVPVLTLWGATAPECGFVPFGGGSENQLCPDPDCYPHLPASIFGKTTFRGYENAMETISVQTILERVDQLILPPQELPAPAVQP